MSSTIDLKLAGPDFTKDIILQIFTYLDTDKDNKLKYADFCSLVSKGTQSGNPSIEDPFLSVLRNIKNRKAPRPQTTQARIDNKHKCHINAWDQVRTFDDLN